MNKIRGVIASTIVICALSACGTTKPTTSMPESSAESNPAPTASGRSFIDTDVLGFSPTSETGETSIQFAILFANADSVKTWKIEMVNARGSQRNFAGTGKILPSTITWDGRTSTGTARRPRRESIRPRYR
jgi:hypothetical protein